jgi:uncharacterized protein YkwD
LAALVAVSAPAAFSQTARGTSVAALEAGLLQQLNAVRTDRGLSALRSNAKLAAAADQHSREMADDGYFDHNSFDGTPFTTRIARWYPVASYRSWAVGENLLWSSPSVDAAAALQLWVNSTPHRENLLAARWREIGISAVHVGAAPGTYGGQPVTILTADFGVRR